MSKVSLLLFLLAPVLTLVGCGGYAVVEEVEYYTEPYRVQIPPGHLPPPGQCRIWFPDHPPGHQPPPGECYELQGRVPPGAVLIHN